MKVLIIGAGLAGQIANHILSNSGHEVTVIDKARKPTRAPSIVRMKTPALHNPLTGIELRKVTVLRDVISTGNKVKDALLYAQKCLGRPAVRSITSLEQGVETRWVFTQDDLKTLRNIRNFMGGITFDGRKVFTHGYDVVISTIPMPVLLEALGIAYGERFVTHGGYVLRCKAYGCAGVYATLYVPSEEYPFSRIHIHDEELICEMRHDWRPDDDWDAPRIIQAAAQLFGILPAGNIWEYKVPVLKMEPIDEDERRRTVMMLTDEYGIYSLGRYATWRPKLLLDQIPHDVEQIMKMAAGRNILRYEEKKNACNG